MSSDTYETILDELGDEIDIEIVVTYDWSKRRPAVLYGDYPSPAEGGIEAITSVVRVDTGEELVLPSAELTKLLDEISENADPEGDAEAAYADYLYALRRDEELEFND